MEHQRVRGVPGIRGVRSKQNVRPLKLLFISYPLLAVTEASAGGAEQILWALERELHNRGSETWVAAAMGSKIAGRLVETGQPATEPDQLAQREAQQIQAISALLAGERFDCIHDMSGSWFVRAGEAHAPVLATLHLPRSFYPPALFAHVPRNVGFNCVSHSQAATFSDVSNFVEPVMNGVSMERFLRHPVLPANERHYVLWLGRICEEKGPHHALDVAFAAGERLIIAGTVYPFLYHQKFFAREVLPRLRRSRNQAKYISSPSFHEKLNLLRHAKALVITSTAPETSSLVAMEAAACGTPVIALRSGAVPEVVREGVTGWIGNDLDHIRALLPLVSEIRGQRCREYAMQHFSAASMADEYLDRYTRLIRAQAQKIPLHA